jgi:hypothetical protein
MTRRFLKMALLLVIACKANREPEQAHGTRATALIDHSGASTQRVDWQVLPWQDRSMAWLREGTRIRLVLGDSSTYVKHWREVVGDTFPPPSVDFRQRTVVLLAAPSRTTGGYYIGVDSVFMRSGSDTLVVSVHEVSPGDRCAVSDDGSRPIMAGTIPASSRVVTFLEVRSESDCK